MSFEIPINNDLNSDALNRNRLEELTRIQSGVGKNLSETDKRDYAKAARGFESMFVHMLMKEMKSAMLDSFKDSDSSSASFGADTLMGYADMLLSDEVSRSGEGVGIASMLFEQLTGGLKLDPIRTISAPETPASTASPERAVPKTQSPAATPIKNTFLDKMVSRLGNFGGIISEAAEKFGVPENLVKAVITAESAGNPKAVSSAGAKGLMQLMDGTAKELGVGNSFDPRQNIFGGTKYLSKMLEMFDDDLQSALAAYNAGPGNVMKYGGIPPFSETQAYVRKVMKYADNY